MKGGARLLIAAAGWLLLPADGALFQAPAEVAAPFRPVGLPIDVDTIHSLSRQLVVLGVEAAKAPEPSRRRAGCQLLAVAAALDPLNREARDVAKQLAADGSPVAATRGDPQQARAEVWQLLEWLGSDQAGQDGQTLAGFIGDAMAVIDPDNPRVPGLRQKGEDGRWARWVPDLAAFQEAKPPEPERGGAGRESTSPPEAKTAGVRLKQAQVLMPVFYYGAEGELASGVLPLRLTAWMDRESDIERSQMELQIVGMEEGDRLARIRQPLLKLLRDVHGPVPAAAHAMLSLGNKASYAFRTNGTAISAPAAVLLDAAFSGRAPVAGLSVLGALNDQGAMMPPSKPWERLLMMDAHSGGRLIVPKQMSDMLGGLLVLEKPEFFVKHEVLTAANFKELVERAGTPESGSLADALEKFAEIRRVGEGKPVGQFVAHPSTRQRLAEVVQLCPDHSSARMLLLQGGGNRPRCFSKDQLAREIRRSVQPMAWFRETNGHNLDMQALVRTHEACRKELDPLASKVDIQDRPLYEEAIEVVNYLRTLRPLLRRVEETEYKYRWDAMQKLVVPQATTMRTAYGHLMEQLDELTGEDEYQPGTPPPVPPRPSNG
jgi:hypothetical protein